MLNQWEKLVLLFFMISSVLSFFFFVSVFCASYLVLLIRLLFLINGVLWCFLQRYLQELIQKIKSKGMRPRVALKPWTPIEVVYPLVGLPLTIMFSDCLVCGWFFAFLGHSTLQRWPKLLLYCVQYNNFVEAFKLNNLFS